MRIVTLLILGLLLSSCATGVHAEIPYYPPAEVRPGMKGHGLSVFKGTEPARFDFEVVGRLANAFYGRDIILIKMSGQNLEKTRIIAGMSGSPVYIDDKLLGAVAYGWSFPNEPIAGVTPAESMLADAARTRDEQSAGAQRKASALPPSPLQRLQTPLWMSGFSAGLIESSRESLELLGLSPEIGMAGNASAADSAEGPDRFEPGSSISVPLVRGDWNAAATGTVTFVDGETVGAFGHPFFGQGPTNLPMYTSRVEEIFSGAARSFKFGTALREVGAVRGDWNSAIVGFYGKKAGMVPVAIQLAKPAIDYDRTFHVDIVDHRDLTPVFLGMSIANAIEVGLPDQEDAMVEARLAVALDDGGTFEWSDRFFVSGGALPRGLFAPLGALMGNPFRDVRIRSAEASLTLKTGRETAYILEAFPADPGAVPGETLSLNVLLEPYGRERVSVGIEIPVPEDAVPGTSLRVQVASGSRIGPVGAPPENYEQLARAVQNYYRNDHFTVRLTTEGRGMIEGGEVLSNLPATVRERLRPSEIKFFRAPAVRPSRDHLFPSGYVLDGMADFTVKVLPPR